MIFETIITSMFDEALKEYESNCSCDAGKAKLSFENMIDKIKKDTERIKETRVNIENINELTLADYEMLHQPEARVMMRQWAFEQAMNYGDYIICEKDEYKDEEGFYPFEVANKIYEYIITGKVK